jgi:hypothetical protein
MLAAPGDQCGASKKPDPKNKLPSYLMVGDSISQGIESGGLFSLLNTTVQAAHSPGNACNTNRGAHCVQNWLDGCAFDIVSFNFGIHDASRNQEHTTLAIYTKMLTNITNQLLHCREQRGTKLLYVLTTPVPTNPKNASIPTTNVLNADVLQYNAIAATIMSEHQIETLDMYTFVNEHCGVNYSNCDWSPGQGNVHFNYVGWEQMAKKMAPVVRALLHRPSTSLLHRPLTSPEPAVAIGPSCGCITGEQFADMHDGDVKNVTLTEQGVITIAQSTPVAWSVSSKLDLSTCVASVDFSKSSKPKYPPVSLDVRVLQSSVGTLLLEFTDSTGTLNPNKTYPLNLWTTEVALPAADACASFSTTSFQDMHDGDVKSVAIGKSSGGGLVMTMGQAGVWNLTAVVDAKTCKATVDFSKSAKPKFPPVPLEVSISVASGNDRRDRFMLTFTDPSKTISPSATYPLNIWEGV